MVECFLMNSQWLQQDCYPFTSALSLTICYHTDNICQGLSWRAGILLSKLAGATLQPDNLATEHCCPVWSRAGYARSVNSILHHMMHLILGCMQYSQVSWPHWLTTWHCCCCCMLWNNNSSVAFCYQGPSKLVSLYWCIVLNHPSLELASLWPMWQTQILLTQNDTSSQCLATSVDEDE